MARALLVLAAGLILPGILMAADATEPSPIVVVANSASPIEEISLRTLRRIYLGKVTALKGIQVEPLHLRSGSAERESFSRIILGKTEAALRSYWIRQALTGGFIPPREVRSAQQVLENLRERPGAIGYMDFDDAEAARSGLRIVKITGQADSN